MIRRFSMIFFYQEDAWDFLPYRAGSLAIEDSSTFARSVIVSSLQIVFGVYGHYGILVD